MEKKTIKFSAIAVKYLTFEINGNFSKKAVKNILKSLVTENDDFKKWKVLAYNSIQEKSKLAVKVALILKTQKANAAQILSIRKELTK